MSHVEIDKTTVESIANILFANGESFLADDGVDRKVCQQVAQEILDRLNEKPVRVMVAVRGGCIQGALADRSNISLQISDFDEFDSEPRDNQGRTEDEAQNAWEQAQTTMHPIL